MMSNNNNSSNGEGMKMNDELMLGRGGGAYNAAAVGSPSPSPAATAGVAAIRSPGNYRILLHLVKQLQESLAIIPTEMKSEYVQAQAVANVALSSSNANNNPDLELLEDSRNNPHPSLLFFLESEKYNVLAAALKVILYWKTRVELFGSNSGGGGAVGAEALQQQELLEQQLLRPYLPLQLHSNLHDLAVYQTGFFVPLPTTTTTAAMATSATTSSTTGQELTVFFCDPSRLGGLLLSQLNNNTNVMTSDQLLLSCLRCIFALLDEAVRSRKKCVILMVWNKSDQVRYMSTQSGIQMLLQQRIEKILSSLPIINPPATGSPTVQIVVCQGNDWGSSPEPFYQNTFQFDSFNNNSKSIKVLKVGGCSRQEVAHKLTQIFQQQAATTTGGRATTITINSLPVSVGGTWNYESFFESLAARIGTTAAAGAVSSRGVGQNATSVPAYLQHLQQQETRTNLNLPNSSSLLDMVSSRQGIHKRKEHDVGAASSSTGDGLILKKRGCLDSRKYAPVVAAAANATVMYSPPISSMAAAPADGSSSSTNPVHVRGLQELESAITLLPEHDRAALMEARRIAPDLAAKEAPPLRYLLFENYNAWAAARRLAAYWAARKRIFEERAFLPMNQTGEGTLSRDDVAILRSGYYLLLPSDEQGRPVICGDPARRGNHARLPRLRLCFYMFSILAECEKTQTDGAVIVAILQNQPNLDGAVRECAKLVLETMPIRVHRVHLVHPPLNSTKTFLQSLVPICLKLFGRFIEKRASVHVADNREDLLTKLTSHGLRACALPERIGGGWSYENFNRWQELRMCYEWELPVVGARSTTDLPFIPPYTAKARSELNEEEKVERKRRLNVLHSRRKRERSRVEREVLRDQVKDLRVLNEHLTEDNGRLEDLLGRAKRVVAAETETDNSKVSAIVTDDSAKKPPPPTTAEAPRESVAEQEDPDRLPLPGLSAATAAVARLPASTSSVSAPAPPPILDVQSLLAAAAGASESGNSDNTHSFSMIREELQRQIQQELLLSSRGAPLQHHLPADAQPRAPAAHQQQTPDRLPHLSISDALRTGQVMATSNGQHPRQSQWEHGLFTSISDILKKSNSK